MTMAIVGAGTAKAKNLDAYKVMPEFRKATLNMILAAASQDEAFSSFPGLLTEDNLHSSGLVLGSSYGELGTTISFLDQLSQSGVARPLLFQNSLHNSTLGFLAIRLKVLGPAITVSNGLSTGENALELAFSLLNATPLAYCVVTAVDSIVTQLRIDTEHSVGSAGEGAATVIVTRRETAEAKNWPVLGYVNAIDYQRVAASEPHTATSEGSYHSDALEHLITHLRSGSKSKTLNLRKSDGNQTVIHLE
jgi:3-oxoacyl-(acyl-carrier-protein) synthase